MQFLSNETAVPKKYSRMIDEAACDFLAGIRFDFNANVLIDWSPAFEAKSEDEEGDLRSFARLSWDTGELYPDDACPIVPSSECYHLTFDSSPFGPITAIKGYVDRIGKFAGLLLRKGREWDSQVFGRSTGFEVEVFELAKGEMIDGIYLTHKPSGPQTFMAIAVSSDMVNLRI